MDATPRGSLVTPLARQAVGAALAALGVSALAAGVVGGLSGMVAYSCARPRPVWGREDPPEGVAESVAFTSADGETGIRGWFLPVGGASPAPTVILCHGIWTGRRECLPLALRLHEAGYNVLTFDFRAHGESAGRFISVGYHEMKDVIGAVRFVRAQPSVDPARIGVLGFSMGAASAILAAERCPEIAAVVADSAYASFVDAVDYSFKVVGKLPPYPFAPLVLHAAQMMTRVNPRELRPVDAVGGVSPRPLLLIHGQEDEIVPVRHASMLFKAAGEPKDLWVVPGAHHVGARDLCPDEYFERVEGFLHDALRAPRIIGVGHRPLAAVA